MVTPWRTAFAHASLWAIKQDSLLHCIWGTHIMLPVLLQKKSEHSDVMVTATTNFLVLGVKRNDQAEISLTQYYDYV